MDAPATVLWTMTAAMSMTAPVTLAAMMPMIRSPVRSAMVCIPLSRGRQCIADLLLDFFSTYFRAETIRRPVARRQLANDPGTELFWDGRRI